MTEDSATTPDGDIIRTHPTTGRALVAVRYTSKSILLAEAIKQTVDALQRVDLSRRPNAEWEPLVIDVRPEWDGDVVVSIWRARD